MAADSWVQDPSLVFALRQLPEMTEFKPKRALLSVSDKSGLTELADSLRKLGCELIATGGTGRTLQDNDILYTELSQVTEFPEIMDGRVKTLHPLIHGGILSRRVYDEETVKSHKISEIDLVVVNLYPFEQTINNPNHNHTDAVDNIDIGGPTLIRAAAKNHQHVLVVVEPTDYSEVIDLLSFGKIDLEYRIAMASKAFQHIAAYDIVIANYFSKEEPLPEKLLISADLRQPLRYGENPHQRAGYYKTSSTNLQTFFTDKLLQGKELSYNNIADATAAFTTVSSFFDPTCVIVKHNTPCGVAQRTTPKEAYEAAFGCDPTSAFGGVIAFNREVDAETVSTILQAQFVEVILAPKFQLTALDAAMVRPAVRLIEIGEHQAINDRMNLQQSGSGFLFQDADQNPIAYDTYRCVTKRQPDEFEKLDLEFAWRVVRFVKSNAIVLGSDRRTIGIGGGQTSRVMSVRIALWKAQDEGLDTSGAVLASDAFFPFPDSIEIASKAGISAVIQPGGSVKDDAVIEAANAHQIAMIFTGLRHFRH